MGKEPDGGYQQHEDEQRNEQSAHPPARVSGPARLSVDDLTRHILSNL
jgi:hypothetical protein